jgi:2-C-methyl-D-erythritol 4-phosphate cytidylyltransferase
MCFYIFQNMFVVAFFSTTFLPMTNFFALIPASGIGSRMGAGLPKQYLDVAGIPMLQRVIQTFAVTPLIRHVFVVVSQNDKMIEGILSAIPHFSHRVSVVYVGGDTRRETVLNGLTAMDSDMPVAPDDWVLVHDAARPGLTPVMIETLISVLRDDPVGGLLALQAVDTIKQASSDSRSVTTLNREEIWLAQTPQMFRYSLLRKALEQTAVFTDEASAVEALGLKPRLVTGSPRNLKVTAPDDLLIAEFYLNSTGIK